MRGYLTPREYEAMHAAQGGACACGCGRTEPFEADHTIPVFFRPGKPDQLLAPPCHREKTARDRKDIAKAKRRAGETGAGRKRAWPKGRKLQGRGFERREA